ncbi:MAG: hypothetical protein AAF519_01260 [Bacteroidota bacterium]
MKRFAIIITLLIIVLFGSYLGYDYYQRSLKTYDLLNYVPESASLVYETSGFFDTWNSLVQGLFWNSLETIEKPRSLNQWFGKIDSLQAGSLDRLTNKRLILSWHRTSRNASDLVLYIDTQSAESQKALAQILNIIQEESQVGSHNRMYQGFKIQELRADSETSFSYIIHENIFVGSYTPFLVEDVIRLIINDFNGGFYNQTEWFSSVPKLGSDQGNMYLNIARLEDLFKTLSSDIHLKTFAGASYFDLNLDDNSFLFSGFTETSSRDYLNTLAGQTPQKNNFKYFLSNSVGYFLQIGIQDGLKWHSSLLDYWNLNDEDFLKKRLNFGNKYDFDFERAYGWMGKGLALASKPSIVHDDDKLVLIDAKDISEALNHLNLFSESLYEAGDSVYIEQFDDISIREIKVSEFPYFMWGPIFKGFDKTFYTVIDDYLVFAERIDAVKGLLADIEIENTLGRSVEYSRFEATTLEESNFKIVVNTTAVLDQLIDLSRDDWKKFLLKNQSALDDFRYVAVDFSALDDGFYSNLSIDHSFSESPAADYTPSLSGTTVALNYPIASKPFVVRSHVDNSREVIIQDSLNYIMLISADGNKLWEREIDGSIVSGILQLDYYKNGKLQYFFTTSDQIYIIDRLGNRVEDFPKKVDFKIAGASVIDYDRTKRYRFLVHDERGNLYLFSKEGISLTGWDPKPLSNRLAAEPFHLRVRGQDMIIAIQRDGVINVFNRRGTDRPGFPINLEGRFESDIHVKTGNDLSSTEVSVVSNNGLLVRFNLLGEIKGSQQLYRPNEGSKFRLVVDALDKTYTIVRQDFNRLVFINSNGEEFLSKDYLNDDNLSIQYYNFSRTNQLYIVTDMIQGFSYIYDENGVLVSSRPIDSQFEVSMIYYDAKKSYEIFVTSGNTFKRLNF